MGLEIITFLWVGGQSAIAKIDSHLYMASAHLEFFCDKWYAIENVYMWKCVSQLLVVLLGHTV